MYCGSGSLVKVCGLRRIKFYDLHTSVDRTRRRLNNGIVSLCPVLPDTHVVVSSKREDAQSQSINQTTWAESDVTVVTVTCRVVVSVSMSRTRDRLETYQRREKNCQRLGLGHLRLVSKTNFRPNCAGHINKTSQFEQSVNGI